MFIMDGDDDDDDDDKFKKDGYDYKECDDNDNER